jgi:uracil-DNA glycosylase
MNDVLELVAGNIIVCLGYDAYKAMTQRAMEFPEISEKLKNKKILGIYHPSGSRNFYDYFEKSNEIITKRKLKTEVQSELKNFVRGKQQYGFLRHKDFKFTIDRNI